MLPVLLSIFLARSASATYYLSQPPPPSPPAYLTNRIDRPPPVYGGGYGGGFLPPPSPLSQGLYPGVGPGYPPVVHRVPLPYPYPRPVAGIRPNTSPVSQSTLSDLVTLLSNQVQLNNLAASSDYYDGYEEKGQADTEKLEGLRSNFGGFEKLRTGFPGALIRSTLRESVANEKVEDDQKNVVALSDAGNGMVIGMNQATAGLWNQVVKEGLPSTSVPVINIKVVPQGSSVQTQSQPLIQLPTKKATVQYNNDIYTVGGEGPTLQVNVEEEKEPEFQLANSGIIDQYSEVGDAQSGTGTLNAAGVLGLRKIPFQRQGELFFIPSGVRMSKSISHAKPMEPESTEGTPKPESDTVER